MLPTFEAKRVFIVSKEGENDWVEPYINELMSFPNGRFDDQVDSLVQALFWAEPRVNPGGRIFSVDVAFGRPAPIAYGRRSGGFS